MRYSKEFEQWFLLRVGMPTEFFISNPTPENYEKLNDLMDEERKQVEMLEKVLKKRKAILRKAKAAELRLLDSPRPPTGKSKP